MKLKAGDVRPALEGLGLIQGRDRSVGSTSRGAFLLVAVVLRDVN